MNSVLVVDKIFKGEDYNKAKLPKAEYENCIFDNCTFSQSDLRNITFAECEFIDCDLSNADVKETAIKETSFIDCKILGVNFNDCNSFLLSFTFTNCTLNLSSFYKLKLKNNLFNNCKLNQVDFTETNLTGSVFEECDLENAIFTNTILEKTDFRTAFNFTIDPENNSIKKAKFSKDNIAGLLVKYAIEIT